MQGNKEKFIEEDILIAYLHDELSAKERLEVEAWLAESPKHKELYKEICNAYYAIQWTLQEKTINIAKAKKTFATYRKECRFRYKNYSIAAISILLLGIGSLLFWNKISSLQTPSQKIASSKRQYSQVTLLLSNDSTILLNKPQEVLIATQDSLTIVVDSSGQIHYNNINKTKKSQNNTLIIPRGCEYFITLSDGTKVWLGADSRFEYPITFENKKRLVKLDGEAYFDVAKDSLCPFIVYSDNFKMQVYGTKFNLNTYDKTQVQLTLVSGSVGFKANASAKETFLQPGQLGEANTLTGKSYIKNVDIETYISWKDGYVIFKNESLESIMEKASRWYNVEVFFESNDLRHIKFYGNMEKYKNINEFLNYLEKVSNAHFKVNNQTIIVREN